MPVLIPRIWEKTTQIIEKEEVKFLFPLNCMISVSSWMVSDKVLSVYVRSSCLVCWPFDFTRSLVSTPKITILSI